MTNGLVTIYASADSVPADVAAAMQSAMDEAITTGACAVSATATDADTSELPWARVRKDTDPAPAPAPAPAPDEESVVTVQSGYLEGGGRY